MDNKDWNILKVLYNQKNITKTAQLLFLSQPALTHRLKQMEKEFGIKIFHGGRRGIQFTPQGEYLALSADNFLNQYLKVQENLKSMSSDVTGTLRLGVSNLVTRYKLPTILRLFQEQYPKVEFKVKSGWSSQIFKDIYNQEVHVGLIRGDYNWKGQKQLLFEESMYVASKNKINVDDLPNLRRIDYKTDSLLKTIIDNWWNENFSSPPLNSIEVDQVDTCKELVINGLGYGILPSLVLNGADQIHKIQLKDHKGTPITRKTWMYYHRKSLELNLVEAFVQFVENLDFEHIDSRSGNH